MDIRTIGKIKNVVCEVAARTPTRVVEKFAVTVELPNAKETVVIEGYRDTSKGKVSYIGEMNDSQIYKVLDRYQDPKDAVGVQFDVWIKQFKPTKIYVD